HCALASADGDTLHLTLEAAHEHLLVETRRAEIEQLLAAASGQQRRVEITVGELAGDTPARAEERVAQDRQADAEAAIEGSAVAQALRDTFDATLRPGSVKPAPVGGQ
ncbi:MAG: DNA polymerase III subunit gamma/tau, partial [Sinobacteraceae bacterium]|nr:DNA polymerase III subunit gamma/tau [Nevskiaceae bacterium]